MDNKALKALLDHVGIEASDGINLINEDTLSNLMNFTLQCLGGIRQIVHTLEKERLSKEAVGEIHSRNVTVLKETFKLAASKFLDATVSGVQINDLDPCRHLLESFPDETKFIDKRWMKLHWAITSYTDMESPEEKILQMASADPESIRELDKEGRSILHYAARLESRELLGIVANLSQTSNGGYGPNFPNLNGALPLHNAARFNRSYGVYHDIFDLYPQAVYAPNEAGTLVLHWAAAKNTNLNIIESIIESYPEAITMVNHEGCLPLHTAGQNICLEVVKLIHSKYPEAIYKTDAEGGYPLHHASCMNNNIEVVKFLYTQYPDAISTPQADGVLPIHLAASRNSSPIIMKYLLDLYPTGATRVDAAGWLPLHCLLNNESIDMRSNRISCLKILLSRYPEGILVKNLAGYSPLDMVFINHHHRGVLRLLLRAYPDANRLQLHDLNWAARKDMIMSMAINAKYSPPCPGDTISRITQTVSHPNQQDVLESSVDTKLINNEYKQRRLDEMGNMKKIVLNGDKYDESVDSSTSLSTHHTMLHKRRSSIIDNGANISSIHHILDLTSENYLASHILPSSSSSSHIIKPSINASEMALFRRLSSVCEGAVSKSGQIRSDILRHVVSFL